MSCVIRRGVRLLPAAAFALVFVFAGPAHASCAEPNPTDRAIDEAHTVFVGTVTDLQYDGLVATFRVEDVWKGDVAGTAVVSGGPTLSELEAAQAQGAGVATSVDRYYDRGQRYLVVSYARDGDALLDNDCSATQPLTSDLDRYRPASARGPVAAADPIVEVDARRAPAWVGPAGLVVVLIAATAVVVLRARRHHGSGAATP